MKHSVAPQSRKAILLAFFCAVCNVMGIRIALRFGRNTSLLIARAKANLLRQGKNPVRSRVSSIRPRRCFDFPVLSFSGSEGHRHCPLSGIGVALSLGPQPKGRFVYSLLVWVVRGFSLGNDAGCVHIFCRGGKVLCVFLRLLGSRIGVVRGSYIFCRSP